MVPCNRRANGVIDDDAAENTIQLFVRKLLQWLGGRFYLLAHCLAPQLAAGGCNGPICPAAVTAITKMRRAEKASSSAQIEADSFGASTEGHALPLVLATFPHSPLRGYNVPTRNDYPR